MRLLPGDIIQVSFVPAHRSSRDMKYYKVLLDDGISEDCFVIIDLSGTSVTFYEECEFDEDDEGDRMPGSEYLSSRDFAYRFKRRYFHDFSAGSEIEFSVYSTMPEFLRGNKRGSFITTADAPAPEPERTDNSVETTD